MEIGDVIHLKNQDAEVVKCKKCGKSMINLDADQLAPGDLALLKRSGVRISNPETEDPICINCEFKESFGQRLARWFESDSEDDDDDDSDFFTPTGIFGGSSHVGGGGSFGGGFGGFGGGGFSGGGASRSF